MDVNESTTTGLTPTDIVYLTQSIHIPPIVAVNALVLITFRQVKHLRTPDNYVIAFLATADLLVGAIVIPISLEDRLNPGVFSKSLLHCTAYVVLWSFIFTLSLSMLTLLNIERYLAICHPYWYVSEFTCQHVFYIAATMISLDVVVNIILHSLFVYFFMKTNPLNCTMGGLPIGCIVPGILMLVFKLLISMACTLKVAFELWKSVRRMYVKGSRFFNHSNYLVIKAKSIRTITLMFTYVILWLPAMVGIVYLVFHEPNVFTGIAAHLIDLNSSLNACSYALSRKYYKSAFMYILRNPPWKWRYLGVVLTEEINVAQKGKVITSSFMEASIGSIFGPQRSEASSAVPFKQKVFRCDDTLTADGFLDTISSCSPPKSGSDGSSDSASSANTSQRRGTDYSKKKSIEIIDDHATSANKTPRRSTTYSEKKNKVRIDGHILSHVMSAIKHPRRSTTYSEKKNKVRIDDHISSHAISANKNQRRSTTYSEKRIDEQILSQL